MRVLPGLMLCFLTVAGCGPAVPREDLGTIEERLPKPPGTEEPHQMPELGRPADVAPEPADADENT